MAAGITVPYDRHGIQTSHLIHASWPSRWGESHPKEFGTTSTHYGVNVGCTAGPNFEGASKPAGGSKRISAFYRKTGNLSHRCEQGFRDTKATCMLTETPVQNYGTMRAGMTMSRLPHETAGLTPVLSAPPATGSVRAMSETSRRSRVSAGSLRSSSSAATSAPSWAKKYGTRQEPWNFEQLPMYDRTNETYGKLPQTHNTFRDHGSRKPAGKSESGFLEPSELVKTLTEPGH